MTPEEALFVRDTLYGEILKHYRNAPNSSFPGFNETLVMKKALEGSVVVWDLEIRKVAIAGAEKLAGIPFSRDWCIGDQVWLHEPVNVPYDGNPSNHLIAIGLHAIDEGVAFVTYRLTSFEEDQKVVMATGIARYGEPIRSDSDMWMIAMLIFLSQEFVGLERQKIPLRERRLAQYGYRGPLPEINVVTLRRTARTESNGHNGSGEHRDYDCQWLVSGHWRKMLCRKRGEDGKPTPDREFEVRPVYVRPHVKGPEDMPLRAPKGTVYHASR